MSTSATIESATPAASTDEQVSTGQPGASAAQESTADPTQVSSAASEEPESRGPDLIREAFARLRGVTTQTQSSAPQAPPASPGPAQESERSGANPAEVQPSAEDAGAVSTAPQPRQQGEPSTQQIPPGTVVLTETELARRIQAESDRKLAKIQRDEEAKREREKEVELRENNPYAYARLMAEREAEQEAARAEIEKLNGQLNEQITLYDRNVLDPLVTRLPDAVRKQVLEGAGEGIPGRGKIAQGALKVLEEHWKTEGAKTARTRLMKDESFIKEVLARHGGMRIEPDSTPSLPASSTPAPTDENGTMNNFMRMGAAATRQVTGR